MNIKLMASAKKPEDEIFFYHFMFNFAFGKTNRKQTRKSSALLATKMKQLRNFVKAK